MRGDQIELFALAGAEKGGLHQISSQSQFCTPKHSQHLRIRSRPGLKGFTDAAVTARPLASSALVGRELAMI